MTLRIYCPYCSAEVRDDSNICPSCNLPLDDVATRRLDSNKLPSHKSISFDSLDNARFVPGAILADRYRIVGLLGKGGMGEVYRADDLKLGQPVALKFLPEHLLSDGAALARFHREVRVARQVSHKNVCRVYDIGETDGRHFLSMEYIKGEELSSLLRRIGRLPADKSIQLARQICAGLAAAHDVGILHRDLKPSNVMIDGDGNARILDFGLAGLGEEFAEDELAAGTPAYMAPEQIEGEPFTVRSDIYSLGLLLYELFTSQRAFEAPNLGELMKLRRSQSTPATPTSIVKDLDPLIEKVIDRCVRRDPAQRPASALQVAAALPGGDPIAAALAAGETPSPEMVAAAPKQGILRPAIAAGLFVSLLILLGLSCWLTKYAAIYRFVALDDPPEALRAHARDVIKKLGYPEQPIDRADGVILKEDYIDYIAARDQSPNRWEQMRREGPGPYRFWYRQSPRYFSELERIEADKPALDVSGMVSMYLDMKGRLHWFIGVPPQREPPGAPAGAEPPKSDWSIPFQEAGLDLQNFQPVPSSWVPLHAYDTRAAWEGVDPSQPQDKIHVEAAAFRGKLIYFETIYPWDQPLRQEEVQGSGRIRALIFLIIGVFMTALLGSVILARRNLRSGRGDRKGATRVAIVYFVVGMLVWLFSKHHSGVPDLEFDSFFSSLTSALFSSIFLWLLYVGLEPFVRRRWPDWIISWSRLLAGDFHDPLVGRDILIGSAAGAVAILCSLLAPATPRLLGQPPELIRTPGSERLGALFFSRFASEISAGLFLGFIAVFMLLLFVIIARRERIALLLLWLLMSLMTILVSRANGAMIVFALISAGVFVLVLKRFGLLALIVTLFFSHLVVFFPITTELTAWYALDFTIALVLCLLLAAYGFYISLGGQKLWTGKLLEE